MKTFISIAAFALLVGVTTVTAATPVQPKQGRYKGKVTVTLAPEEHLNAAVKTVIPVAGYCDASGSILLVSATLIPLPSFESRFFSADVLPGTLTMRVPQSMPCTAVKTTGGSISAICPQPLIPGNLGHEGNAQPTMSIVLTRVGDQRTCEYKSADGKVMLITVSGGMIRLPNDKRMWKLANHE